MLIVASTVLALRVVALVLALIYGVLVTGVSLLKALKLEKILSDDLIEFALSSFVVGTTYFGTVVLAASLALGFPANRYIALALVSLHTLYLIHVCLREDSRMTEIVVRMEDLFFVFPWLLALYIFYSLYYIYDVYLPGEDILRHYMWSVNLVRNPWKFLSLSPDNYILFHSFEGGVMLLANSYNAALLNYTLLPIGILSMLALAQLTASTLRSPISKKIAALYPLIFSGLGWLYLLFNRPMNSSMYLTTLSTGNEKMYRNLMYLPFTLMWPTPQAFSVAAFLLFLAMLFKTARLQSMSPKAAAAGLFMFSMLATHPPEGVIAAILLAFLALFWGRRLSETLKPVSLGAAVGALAGGMLNTAAVFLALKGSLLLQSLMMLRIIAFFVPLAATLAVSFLSSFSTKLEPLFTKFISRLHTQASVAMVLGAFALLLGLSVSLDPSNTFTTSRADPGWTVGLVPWFIYAVMLGVALPLGMYGFGILASESLKTQAVVLGSLAILSIAIGRILGYINAFGVDTGYWGEKRFLLFVYIALAPPTVYALERLACGRPLRTALISLLLVLLATNAPTVASYWGVMSEHWKISDAEKAALDRLGELLWSNMTKWVLAPTSYSRDSSAFAAPIYYVFGDPSYAWQWQVPELSLLIFQARNLDSPYLYINWITDSLPAYSGWIGRFLLPSLPKVFGLGMIDVYDSPVLMPPLPNGNIALVIPPAWDRHVDEAYLLLSLAGVNFTSVLEIDPALYGYKFIVVPYDPLVESRIVSVDLLRTPIAYTAGNVKIEEDSIELGERSEGMSHIVVWRNPFYLMPKAFNVTVEFKVEEYNPAVPNYLSFIYDFQDAKNYKYVSLIFMKQGSLYALTCSTISGNSTCSVPWPGIQIGEYVNAVGEHAMKVYINITEGKLCMSLDHYKPVCFATYSSGGSFGIRVDRFWSIKIESAHLDAPVPNLLDLRRFARSNYTVVAIMTEGSSNTISETKLGESKIMYVNLVLSKNASLNEWADYSQILKSVFINISFTSEKYYTEISSANLAARRIMFHNLTISATHITVIPNGPLKICVSNLCFNVSSPEYLALENPSSHLEAASGSAVAEAGIGFYMIVRTEELRASGRVYVHVKNSSVDVLEGDVYLRGNLLLLMRRPIIIANYAAAKGVISQTLVYPYLARDLVIQGNSTFSFVMGDSSVLYFVTGLGTSKAAFEPPPNIYSEWESLPLILKHLPWVSVVSALLLASRKLLRVTKRSHEHLLTGST